MFLVAANTARDVLTSQKVTAEAAKRSRQKHLVLSSRARLLIKYISFFCPHQHKRRLKLQPLDCQASSSTIFSLLC